MSDNKRTALLILDGWGIARNKNVSAIDQAKTPFVDSLYHNYPNTRLQASGLAVGLPEGQMGNSEVGHMNLGAGRIVYQDLVRINLAVENGSIAKEPVLEEAFAYAKKEGKKVHFMGLLSDGGVHSHIQHLKGLLSAAADAKLNDVFVHVFTDGRDTDPQGGLGYIADLEEHLSKTTGSIASIVGRYFAMDRDKRWERVKKAYDVMVHGKGLESASAKAVLETSYAAGISDEFIEPAILNKAGTIAEGDVVLCFNFRTDRGRQITTALTQEAFPEQEMSPLNLHYVTMTRYDDTFKKVHVIYEKDNLSETLGEVLEGAGKTQVRIAETEKYPHVTFFFSGGRENEFKGERRLMVSSPKVATYDLQPEMSAYEVRDTIIEDINTNTPDFICLNFANPDMVGHTGDMNAAIIACETVDACAEAVVKAGLVKDYTFIILADHGNADCMRNDDGSPNTAHTTQPVPCFLVGNAVNSIQLHKGVLGDVAPTLLDLLSINKPDAMTGKSLII
ncbi:MAG: 2,3-bisphosphoglycerate-independent phosphoglycerate mutase [Bacteroidetes bacterium]|nr:MAG: 2,3-bisphosphoglycerate-independent phosphoglycerate mutase [Bacteroidota bacterium]